ncbi:MAG: ribose-5-phosphate isomerase RpiA [Planctomycetota bacterium]
MESADLKRLAAEKAASMVVDGMAVGLSTGSTADYATRWLAQNRKNLRCLATSRQTETLASELGLTLMSPATLGGLDILIDGADECTKDGDMIKGGGGALLREKLVARRAKRRIYVMDPSKIVSTLGKFPLPVEVVTFGWEWAQEALAALGAGVTRRRAKGGGDYLTDNGNVILDCAFGTIPDPKILEKSIRNIPGIVETGLFLGIATDVIVGDTAGVQTYLKAS